MMRTLIAITLAVAACAPALRGAGTPEQPLTAAKAFVEAPRRVFPTVDRSTRLDMIDYFEAGSDKASKNQFEGECRITAMNADQLTFESSPSTSHTLTLLPRHRSDTVIMVVTTMELPARDSHVKFYTTSWQPAEQGLFMVPNLNDWVPDAKARQQVAGQIPMTIASASYDIGAQTLTVTNNLSDFLPDEVTNLVTPNMAKKITYRWNGQSMEKVATE